MKTTAKFLNNIALFEMKHGGEARKFIFLSFLVIVALLPNVRRKRNIMRKENLIMKNNEILF